MGKLVIGESRAKAQLRAIDQSAALRILHALAHYLETGEGDVQRLQNIEPPEFRLRVGAYRVRFHDFGATIRITGCKTSPRSLPLTRNSVRSAEERRFPTFRKKREMGDAGLGTYDTRSHHRPVTRITDCASLRCSTRAEKTFR